MLHFGGHDFSCGVRPGGDPTSYLTMKADLLGRCSRGSVADLVRGLDEHFPGGLASIIHLFLEERRRVLADVIRATLEHHEETYGRIWEESRKLVHYLREVDAPIPEALALVARHVLEQQVIAALAQLPELGVIPDRVFAVVDEARALGLTLDLSPLRSVVHRAVGLTLDAVAEEPSSERVVRATALIEGTRSLDIRYGHWATQNHFFRLWQDRRDAHDTLRPLAVTLGFNLVG
jgi:hypothetical protein